MQDIGFDVIGDLFLEPNSSFNWENKASSLYCVITGNISSDIKTIIQTLAHLSKFYQGVFFVPGQLEYSGTSDLRTRTNQLLSISTIIPNVKLLYNQVIIINGVAVIGSNCWNAAGYTDNLRNAELTAARFEDIAYLRHAIQRLQRHVDVKKILVVTNAVPNESLYFGEVPEIVDAQIPIDVILSQDSEHKISHWAFGSYEKIVDVTKDNINYVCNPYNINANIYYAKRLTILV